MGINRSKFLIKYPDILTDKIINKIPKWMFKDKSIKFLDPSIGSGQIVAKLERKLFEYGNTIKDVSKRVFGLEETNYEINNAKHKNVLHGTYEKGDIFNMPKSFPRYFNGPVVMNPPYDGANQLHQRFYNRAFEVTDLVISLQPATPYFNSKHNAHKRKHEAKMIETIKENKTNVEIVDQRIFNDTHIHTDLAITSTFKEKNTSGKLNSIIFKNGETYKNVDIKDINMTQIDPNVFSTIKSKYENYVAKNGSLQDVTYQSKPKNYVAALPKIRGNIGTNDIYTFLPANINDTKYFTTDVKQKREFGIHVKNNKQIKNVYSYLKTYIARFGLAMTKIGISLHRKEFVRVPLVNFDKQWTDEMLIKELNLTQQEYKLIVQTLGNYYG